MRRAGFRSAVRQATGAWRVDFQVIEIITALGMQLGGWVVFRVIRFMRRIG